MRGFTLEADAAAITRALGLPDEPADFGDRSAICPNSWASVVLTRPDGDRRFGVARWGLPSSRAALKTAALRDARQFRQGVIDDLEAIVDEQPDPGVPFVNLRMAEVPLLVDPGSRCLVPFTGWDQRRRSGSDEVIRFDLPAGDIGFFAGVHQSGWRGIHRHDDGVENLNLFAIVCFERLAPTAEPGRKLTPIILSRQYQQEQWMSATWGETFKLVGALTSSRAENPSQETLG